MATDAESKKLSDLRVVDLRAELEKRGLDKTGVKAALLERLQKALLAEGKDPDDYEFDSNEKKPKRLSTNARVEENDTSGEHVASDSSVLMIETPSLEQDSGHDLTQDEETKESSEPEKKIKNENPESPLNLLIGEEEEDLLNSGYEQDGPYVSKEEDEKTTPSGGSATTKEQDSTVKTEEEDKEDDRDGSQDVDAENPDGDADADVEAEGEAKAENSRPRSDSLKDDDESAGTSNVDSANATATAAAASASSPTIASEQGSTKDEHDNGKGKSTKNNPGRSLWVTNLLPSTKAQELKHLLSKYGKVIGAKVVQSSRYPRQRCYGYVTMETRGAADYCIEKLNNTELKGQIIRVAKVRPEHNLPTGKAPKKEGSVEKRRKFSPKSSSKSREVKSGSEKRKSPPLNDKKRDNIKRKDSKEPERDRSRNNSQSSGRKSSLPKSSTAHRMERKADILTFDQIREERERQRMRERERAMREEEKRRREVQRTREIEKRQREESLRLEREREKLRVERERLDRQRVEIMILERDRQRLEREKLEREKQELRRQQMRLEEARRPVKRPSTTSTAAYRREPGTYNDDRKRLVTDHHYQETPPPPRFEVPSRDSAPDMSKNKEIGKDYKPRLAYSKRAEDYPPKRSGGTEFKRDYGPPDRHSGHPGHLVLNSSANASYVNRERERDIREPTRREPIVPSAPPSRIPKDARYVERSGDRSPVAYRPVRDDRERRPVSDHHSKNDIRSSRDHRYPDTSMKEGTRYREAGGNWHSSGAPAVKPFGGMGSSGNTRESWNKSDSWRPMDTNANERWGNSSSRILISGTSGVPNTMYSGGNSNLGLGAGLACPPPPGNSSYSMDRFDSSFKSLNSSRKY